MVTMRGLWTQLFFGILVRIFVFSKRFVAMLKDGESNWLWEKKRLNFRLLNDLKLPRISCIQCVADLFPLTTETFGSEGPIEKISESIKQILDVFSGSGRDAKDESWKYCANELWLQDAPLGWCLSGKTLPNIFGIAIIAINHAVERDDRRFRILLKWHQIWMTPLFSIPKNLLVRKKA